jgi:hypothetical protein
MLKWALETLCVLHWELHIRVSDTDKIVRSACSRRLVIDLTSASLIISDGSNCNDAIAAELVNFLDEAHPRLRYSPVDSTRPTMSARTIGETVVPSAETVPARQSQRSARRRRKYGVRVRSEVKWTGLGARLGRWVTNRPKRVRLIRVRVEPARNLKP